MPFQYIPDFTVHVQIMFFLFLERVGHVFLTDNSWIVFSTGYIHAQIVLLINIHVDYILGLFVFFYAKINVIYL